MKPLKKHPKQQRMEEMTFPIIKPGKKRVLDEQTRKLVNEAFTKISALFPYPDPMYQEQYKGPNLWTGREYLRSINDDNGFTLMPRIVWRVVAVGVFMGAVIYFLSKAI